METEQIETGTFERWTPDDVEAALANHEIVVIDVRSPQEFAVEHIEGAMLMPMPFFRADHLPTQDGKRIVLHCGSGLRSERMAKIASEAGIDPIAHLEGGFTAWKEAKKPHIGTDFMSGAPKKVMPK
ncbi:putative adenylyltransferase/sulfurtransferase MoeZ [Rhodobacteraceae bacterium THAF1]|uniref:rhodanese-like domain-containing protein n=1 Tax=Palleronia sp. THAF1 TaxID=2587842 RepID=UPI000F3D3F84|nr:rhodanese-like domain-containing protein [Palleronia sp. THAF1]QFU10055.1 putative adenylyltransferase/sulfurtransferase MoeZ [Palleronia sp. THAF1]VDC17040.1 putative adenylyltransferase/sulfurtransferase MoeZ [Rhodobacteraceae bacterium THAF1]